MTFVHEDDTDEATDKRIVCQECLVDLNLGIIVCQYIFIVFFDGRAN